MKYKFRGEGLHTAERRIAEKQFKEYQSTYHITDISQCELIESKLFILAQITRLKTKISKLNSNKTIKEQTLIPREWQKTLNSYLDQIITINDKLGLYEEKKKQDDGITYIQTLKKKLFQWREEHPNRFKVCPGCGEPIEIIVNPSHFDIIKHPFYNNNMLFNKQAFQLLEEGKITKLECERIHKGMGAETSDYVEWILEDQKKSGKK